MDVLYSPWRSDYFINDNSTECVFCDISKHNRDEENFVFYRDSICFAVMNRYPYSPGHFMIISHRHVDSPTLLELDEWIHINNLSHKCIAILESYGAEGINMGINIKKAAGAGIPRHLHIHFVPRYIGDTNFITTIGENRVYGVDFVKIFDRIKSLSKDILYR